MRRLGGENARNGRGIGRAGRKFDGFVGQLGGDSSKTEVEFSKKPEDLLVCVLLFLVSFLYTVILSFDPLPVICSVC